MRSDRPVAHPEALRRPTEARNVRRRRFGADVSRDRSLPRDVQREILTSRHYILKFFARRGIVFREGTDSSGCT